MPSAKKPSICINTGQVTDTYMRHSVMSNTLGLNGLYMCPRSVLHHAIIWTNTDIGHAQTQFSEIWIKIKAYSFKKMIFKISSPKCGVCSIFGTSYYIIITLQFLRGYLQICNNIETRWPTFWSLVDKMPALIQKWLGTEHVTSHYPVQRWPSALTHIWLIQSQWVKLTMTCSCAAS